MKMNINILENRKLQLLFVLIISALVYSALFVFKFGEKELTLKEKLANNLKIKSPNYIENGDFEQGNKGLEIYSVSQGEDEEIKPEKLKVEVNEDMKFVYSGKKSLSLEAKEEGYGIAYDIPEGIKYPIFVQANALVNSGSVKLSVLDENGKEIDSYIVDGGEENWEAMPIQVTQEGAKKVVIYAQENDSSFYVDNINIKGYQDYSALFESFNEYKLQEQTQDCMNLLGKEYLKCVEEKTGYTIEELKKDLYEPKIESKGNNSQVNSDKNNNDSVLGANNTYTIKRVFIGTDISEAQKNEYLQSLNILIGEELPKEYSKLDDDRLVLSSNLEVLIFDPTVQSNCKFDTTYFPDIACKYYDVINNMFKCEKGYAGCIPNDPNANYIKNGEYKNDVNYLLSGSKTTGAFQFGGSVWMGGGYVVGDLEAEVRTLKHETGHLFGADDNDDFSNVVGNNIFPLGNKRIGSFQKVNLMFSAMNYVNNIETYSMNEVMDTATINSLFYKNFSGKEDFNFKDQIKKLRLKDENGKVINSGEYKLFFGNNLGNHAPGTVSDSFSKRDNFSSGIINLDNDMLLKRKDRIAGFLLIKVNNKVYRAQYDNLDVLEARLEGKDYIDLDCLEYNIDFETYQKKNSELKGKYSYSLTVDGQVGMHFSGESGIELFFVDKNNSKKIFLGKVISLGNHSFDYSVNLPIGEYYSYLKLSRSYISKIKEINWIGSGNIDFLNGDVFVFDNIKKNENGSLGLNYNGFFGNIYVDEDSDHNYDRVEISDSNGKYLQNYNVDDSKFFSLGLFHVGQANDEYNLSAKFYNGNNLYKTENLGNMSLNRVGTRGDFPVIAEKYFSFDYNDGTCSSICTNKNCGDADGCGGTCSGTCPQGKECNTSNVCVDESVTCTPNCTSKNCGDSNGCDGVCSGTCPEGKFCNDSYACEIEPTGTRKMVIVAPGVDDGNIKIINGQGISFTAKVKIWNETLDQVLFTGNVLFRNSGTDKTFFEGFLPDDIDLVDGQKVLMAVKGPKHVAMYGLFVSISNYINLTNNFLLIPGDLPINASSGAFTKGGQNGTIDLDDYRALLSRISEDDNDSLDMADVNFDGIVNTLDLALFEKYLFRKTDDIWETDSQGSNSYEVLELEKFNLSF